ncbi:hypothetical protein TYRP_003618 [Tyrophagus putrescentiae]|nr:hypothetical protein TYRP_003618 [Tyrophagus putrescentiae]
MGRLYVQDYDFKKKLILEDKGMDGSACQLGAMLALGAQQQTNRSTKRLHMQLAINITETCYQAAMATTVKMVPKRFGAAGKILDVTAYLTNELPESYFILWRLTGNQQYRDRAWQHVEALYRHSRTVTCGGYSSLANITASPPTMFDYQFPGFFSHTLKYLWLIFADHQTVLSLDQWFFNARGHPLPICGASSIYPKEMCRYRS